MAEEQAVDTGPAVIEGTSIELESTVEDIAASLLPQEEEGDQQVAEPVAKPAEPVAGDEKPGTEKAAGTDATIPAGIVDTPPDTWRKEAKEAWTAVPPAVKEELRKREADISDYVARVKQPLVIGQKLTELIQPHLAMFERTNTDPWENMAAMFKIQERLLNGSPEEKLQIIGAFAQQAGVKLEGNALAQAPDSQAQYIRQLEQRIGQMENGVKSVTSVVQEARLAELQDNVRKFAEDTTTHPYFADVADEITRLISTGASRDLTHAYDMACASNPIIRQKMVDAAVAQAAETRAKADKEKVVKARETARPRVRSTTTTATPQPLGDIDSTLKDTLAEIQARH